MHQVSLSIKIYIYLILILAILAALHLFLPQGDVLTTLSERELPASKPVLALANAAIMLTLYGGLGFLGIIFSRKLGFADIWDTTITNRQRFLTPALSGIGIGMFFIISDMIFSRFHSFGPLPHPPFPTSLVASAVAGIGEEIIFRLFFVSFWVWLISMVILKKKYQDQVFWMIALFSALAFAMGHIPSVLILLGVKTFHDLPLLILSEIILLNGVLSLFAVYFFRKFGFLAAVGIHFWTDVMWHVIWGMF